MAPPRQEWAAAPDRLGAVGELNTRAEEIVHHQGSLERLEGHSHRDSNREIPGDYPRGLRNGPWLSGLAIPPPFPVAPTLPVPLLIACSRSCTLLLGLPSTTKSGRPPGTLDCDSVAGLAGDGSASRTPSGNTGAPAHAR